MRGLPRLGWLVVLGLVAAACAPAGEGPPASAPATPPGVEASLLTDLGELVERPGREAARDLAGRMGETGDPRWVPYLVDLLRLVGFLGPEAGDLEGEDPFARALAAVTGEPVPGDPVDAYVAFGSWMMRHRPDPGPAYPGWKAALYGRLDPAFPLLLDQVDDPVEAALLQWGGVGVAGIPELNDPATLTAGEADYLLADELVFGAVRNGEARAYPLRILDHHELANDLLGGERVALANCTLCRSGILYSRTVAGRVLDFRTSGLLRNSNKVMFDVQTRSLWTQLGGEAIAGPLRGAVLEPLPLTLTTWGEWLAEHPDTDVLAIPGTDVDTPPELVVMGGYRYEPGDAYAEYYASDRVWFPILEPPPVFEPKALVATLLRGGAALAVETEALRAAGLTVLAVGEERVVAVPTAGGSARFYLAPPDLGPGDLAGAGPAEDALRLADGRELPRLLGGQAFWFAWYEAHPDTAWWPEG